MYLQTAATTAVIALTRVLPALSSGLFLSSPCTDCVHILPSSTAPCEVWISALAHAATWGATSPFKMFRLEAGGFTASTNSGFGDG